MPSLKRVLRWKLVLVSAIAVLLGATGAPGQSTNTSDMEKACRTYVQGFYDWYLGEIKRNNADPLKLAVKRYRFDAELVRQLKVDWDAQAKSADLVGLDFDPVINGQDIMPGRYLAGKVTKKGPNYLVEISVPDPEKKGRQVLVSPELSFNAGQWTFVNFHFGTEGDLLSTLKQLRDERKNTPN